MTTLPLKKLNTRALVLVAHPDDETIWMGAVILRHPKIHWTIFSLCRKGDPDRYPKFLKACQLYKATPIISDLEDEDILTVKDSIPEIKERVIKILKVKKFDYLFTHGRNGEYGHFRHLGVHQAVKQMLKQKKLAASQVFYFCYKTHRPASSPLENYPLDWRTYQNQIINDNKKAKYILKLTPAELKKKQKIIHEIYGYEKNFFEYKSCLNVETFTHSNFKPYPPAGG